MRWLKRVVVSVYCVLVDGGIAPLPTAFRALSSDLPRYQTIRPAAVIKRADSELRLRNPRDVDDAPYHRNCQCFGLRRP
jgi:hypothetical protein